MKIKEQERKRFDDAVQKALSLSEPKRSESLNRIIKKEVFRGRLEIAMEIAKLLGHELTRAECLEIIEKIVWPD